MWIRNQSESEVRWTSPAQWTDTTTGTTGTSAPSIGSTATVDVPYGLSANFFGGGSGDFVTLDGIVYLTGAYRFNHVHDFGDLYLSGSLVAKSLTANYLFMAGSTLHVQHTFSVTESVDVSDSLAAASEVQVGRLVLAQTQGGIEPIISVSGNSSVEVGNAGNALPGVVTVDAGSTLVGTGVVNGNVADNGLVDARLQLAMGAVTGTGAVRIERDSTATVSSVGPGNTIDFAAVGAALEITGGQGAFGPGTSLLGFGLGNAILFQDLGISGVSRVTAGGHTTLTLTDASGQTVDQVTLAGDESGLSFTLLPNPSEYGGVMLVALPPRPAVEVPVSTETIGRHFTWTGRDGTDWSTSGNWQEAGRSGGAAIPGTLDTATIRAFRNGFTLVTGSGDAASLSIMGNVMSDGRFDVGRLRNDRTLGPVSLTLVGAGSTLDAEHVRFGVGYLAITGGAVVQAGTAGYGDYYLSDGGTLTANLLQNAFLAVDATSRVEVGGSTSGALGVLTIDAGATASNIIFGGTIVDNGRLVTDGLAYAGAIQGDGQIIIRGGSLSVASSLGGRVVEFAGPNAALQLSGGTSLAMPQAISGLAVADSIEVTQGTTAEGFLRYLQEASGGVLNLVSAGGSVLGSFDLSGHYKADQFLLTQQGTADTISVLPVHIDHQVSPGTASGDVFAWTGASGPGEWIDAANWYDETTGSTATVAPGLHDTVDLDARYTLPGNPFVIGAASIAQLTVGFGATLDGTFAAQTVNVTGLSLVGADTTMHAYQLTDYADTLSFTGITIDRAQVAIGTADLTAPTELRDGGFLSADILNFADLSIDPTSRAVLGAASSGTASLMAGALTVEAGQTLQNATLLEGGLVLDGNVQVEFRTEVTGAVTGGGTLAVGSSFNPTTLLLDDSLSAATHIELVANEAEVVFGQGSGAHGQLAGFTVGDLLAFVGVAGATQAVFQPAGASGGQLVLEDQNSQALCRVQLLGDYRGAAFAVSEALGTASVTLTSFHTI